jgi:hypothetical protein
MCHHLHFAVARGLFPTPEEGKGAKQEKFQLPRRVAPESSEAIARHICHTTFASIVRRIGQKGPGRPP